MEIGRDFLNTTVEGEKRRKYNDHIKRKELACTPSCNLERVVLLAENRPAG